MYLLLVLLVCALELEGATSECNTATEIDNSHSIMDVGAFAKRGCQSQCGNLKVPYPFGIVSEGHEDRNCSYNKWFGITCNTTTNPPKALMSIRDIEIYDISDTELRVSNDVAENCYDKSGAIYRTYKPSTDLDSTPYAFSLNNVWTVVGCDDYAENYQDAFVPKTCSSTCKNAEVVEKEGCFGTGCCQLSLNAVWFSTIVLKTYNNHTNTSSFNPCGYAFMGEKNSFNTSLLSNLSDAAIKNKIMDTVPRVLDWVIYQGLKNCSEAAHDSSFYACIYANSTCIDVERSRGYRCVCEQGYEGNPYLSPGCKGSYYLQLLEFTY